MGAELGLLFAAAAAYLLALFLVAYATERRWIPARLARHPLVYAASLGVYATSWSYYGSVGYARDHGYLFLTIYLGVTVAFLLTPVLLAPILRVCREYQLTSLADLFAFRFRSQAAGVLVTLFMLAGTLPYLALQIRAVTDSARVLAAQAPPRTLAFGFCLLVTLFAVLFGARHVSPREKHEGLVVAIAFESVVKLAALLGVAAFAVVTVFGSVEGMQRWVGAHPEAVEAMQRPAREGPWASLLLLAFAAAFLLPRQFHMTFAENPSPRALPTAAWAFPLLLLLLNAAIPPILWAAQARGLTLPPDYYVLGLTLEAPPLLSLFAFLGGVSAASAMLIVSSLALSAMCLNHLLLPASLPDPKVDLYRWVLWGRRMIIALVILAGYGFYLLLEQNQGLVELGLTSFVAVAQFLPGIVGLLYWRRATRWGFLAGLAGGAAVWAWSLLVPLLSHAGWVAGLPDAAEVLPAAGPDRWSFATFWSLLVNGALFAGLSLLTRQRPEEAEAARACCPDSLAPPPGVVAAASPRQFADRLARLVGADVAATEVRRALADLDMSPDERRPLALRALRERIERNLSGLIGPELARMVVARELHLSPEGRVALAHSVRFVEERLERSRMRLRGLAAELDALRRYHRGVLQALPAGVCVFGPEGEVAVWNRAMAALTGIEAAAAVGTHVGALPDPWRALLRTLAEGRRERIYKEPVRLGEDTRWLSLQRAEVPGAAGCVVVVEDLTELHTLEEELAHAERLASIGRIAAGVAHEIGNPLTGIASTAQNLGAETADPEAREACADILAQTRRIAGIVEALMAFSHGGRIRGTAGEAAPVPLGRCLEEALRLAALTPRGRRVRWRSACPADATVRGPHPRLVQLLVNLLSNAADASPDGALVEVEVERAQGQVRLRVRDHGTGMDEEVRRRAFEPFFTTKPPGEGTGLGLALVYSTVRELGGEVRLDSAPGRGTTVTVTLPEAQARTRTEEAAP